MKIKIISAFFLLLSAAPLMAAEKNKEPIPKEPIDEIIVYGGLSPLALQHATSSITILSAEDIAATGQPFLADVLRQVPGLSLSQSGGAGSLGDIRIRGGESDHTKVLINGIEVNDTSSSQFNFGLLLSHHIERVEIIRGSQSIIHGANATGGIIAITTKVAREPTIDYQADGGSFGTWHGALNMSGGGKNVKFGGGLDVYQTDGDDISAAGRDEQDEYSNYTAHARADYTKGDFRGTFTLRHVKAKHDGDNPSSSYPDVKSQLNTIQSEIGTKGRYDFSLPRGIRLREEIGFSLMDLERRFSSEGFSSVRQEQRLDIHHKTALDYRNINLALLRGWQQEKLLSADGERSESETYAALEAMLKWAGFDLTAGLRGEFYHNSDNGLIWRVSGGRALPLLTFMRLRGSYGTSINKPTLYDLYGSDPNYASNPGLEPEEAISWDVGFDVHADSFVRGLVFSVAAFGIDVDNEFGCENLSPTNDRCLDNGDGIDDDVFKPINLVGTSKRIGAEVNVDWLVLDDVRLAANYTYTRAKKANGEESVRRPKSIASLSALWQPGRFSLGGDLLWVGNQRDEIFRSPNYADPIPVFLDSYFVFNLHGSYRVNEDLDVFVRLDNITDEKESGVFGYQRRGFGAYAGIKGRF